jgi:exopolyphosphatase / guanosine-5'-triphosphate,3'-diphosphate pyrophosphatase
MANKAPRGEKTVAFIDMGTNSIRLLLVRFHPNLTYTVLSVQKETIRLGEDEFTTGALRPEAMQRAAQVCKHFADMARVNRADEIIAVATSATREASNKDQFLRLLRKQAKVNMHTVSGTEEARLIYLGVTNGFDLKGGRALFIDIGGGSTELIVGDQNNYETLDSLKLGAIRLSSLFFTAKDTEEISPKKYKAIREYVRNSAIRSLQKLSWYNFDFAVGSSGTIENLANVTAYRVFGRPRAEEDVFTYEQLSKTTKYLCSLNLKERAEVAGLNTRRADIIIGGAAILHVVMKELEIDELRITDQGMQHGLLVDYMLKHGYLQRTEQGSLRTESVQRFARKMQVDMDHAKKVRDLSLAMFDSAREAGLHKIDDRHRELLEHAAILHDLGIFLSYSGHEAHSYYLIRNSNLVGFDQDELQVIASLAYFHRKRFPSTKYPEFTALEESSHDPVQQMAILLRIAEGLDRSHQGSVIDARFQRKKKEAVLEVECSGDCQLEMWSLEDHAKVFRKAFDYSFAPSLKVGTRQPA